MVRAGSDLGVLFAQSQHSYLRGISTTAVGDEEVEAEAGAMFPPLPMEEAETMESPDKGVLKG